MTNQRLIKQMALIMELDQLKSVLRRTRVKCDGHRLENSAEHSWHVALMAILLQEHANAPVDISRVVKMLLLHDIVEIDAGDTFVYDQIESEKQEQKELQAAERLFAMLPDDQGEELFTIWREFEKAESDDAKFAKAIDRIIPILMNHNSQGQSWVEHGIARQQVININQRIEKGSEVLWQKALEIIDESVANGWLKP
ncbi:HD domain-containing protein [Vibrio sp. 99-8-1]|uniref:HD domain-containing protein n=1 Tax=Vibrio sp. 99-8-1 TaxID=2607602 RepID=UPI001493DC6C|nr:HD domain-containing protein [Vibrio sp. 99-8-1]NOI65514.1 HD domain-containing protein [Vibrio sp. 99-8-1]